MKTYILIFFVFLNIFIFNTTLYSQTLDWAKQFNEINNGDVQQNISNSVVDNLGNILTIGYLDQITDIDPNASICNLNPIYGSNYISKLDSNGNFIWAKQYSVGGKIILDSYNNIIMLGRFYGTKDFDPSSTIYNLTSTGAADIFVLKLDSVGDFIWVKTIEGSGNHDENPGDIFVDNQENIIYSGGFEDSIDVNPNSGIVILTNNLGYSDGFLSKLDSSGNFIWGKQFNSINVIEMGALKVNELNEIITTSRFSGIVDFDPSSAVYNLESEGNNTNTAIVKLDSNGNFIWAKQNKGLFLYGNIDINDFGDIFICGTFNQITDFDPSENSYELIPIGNADGFVLKLDINGNFVWVKQFGGNNIIFPTAIAVSNNNVYSTGYFYGTTDFDPDENQHLLSSIDSTTNNVFLSKLDSNGNFVWANSIEGNLQNYNQSKSYSIQLLNNNVYITGEFTGSCDFNPSGNMFNMSTLNMFGISTFIQKINDQNLSTENMFLNNDKIIVYPNPTNAIFYINFNSIQEKVTIDITNILGQGIQKETVYNTSNYASSINGSNGIYFIKITNQYNNSQVFKLIKN